VGFAEHDGIAIYQRGKLVSAMDEQQRKQILERAYATLDRREEQERAHQDWRDQHYPEALLPTSSPRQLKRDYWVSGCGGGSTSNADADLVRKTTWTPPTPAPAPQAFDDERIDSLWRTFRAVANALERLGKCNDALTERVVELETKLQGGGE
jgi:hypothetical protein